jgi:hypothetical protein
MDSPTEGLGPLPLGDRQDTLQQLSLKALRNRLPEDKFLVRDERTDDKGVDIALEAKVEVRVPKKAGGEEVMHGFTNCRGQGQLKSIDNPEPNADGSVSYSIETINLNYLLYGPNPIYFLWLAPTDEIRYAWAKDEWRRLDAENPGWRSQGTFTIRFRNVLDTKAVDAIHERIVTEARFVRRINEILARASLSEGVVVSIDPKSLASTDPLQLYQWITSSGRTIVSSGYGVKVLEWFGVLNPEHRRDARVNLVAAYAQVSLGRNYEAAGSLSVAKLGADGLSPEDREFLGYLDDVCAYQTSRIDQAEYLRREGERGANKTGVAAAGHRLEVLRQERLRSQDRDRRAELLEEMRSAAVQVYTAADARPAHKLNARIHLMSAEGDALIGRFTEESAQIEARKEMGFPSLAVDRQAGGEIAGAWEEWEKGARSCIEDAATEGHPLLLADAVTARASVYQAFILTKRMQAAALHEPWEPPQGLIGKLMQEVERAMVIYRQAGNLEGETRSKLLLADLFDASGQEQAAKNLAEGAVGVARAMGYSRLESHAREYLDGRTLFQIFQAELAKREAVDEDVRIADETDEAVRRMARFSLASLRLPQDRLPVLEREAASLRLIARERVNFCRHIGLIQDLSHTLSPTTCYATDPSHACVCEKLGHRSNVESTDAATVIGAFKRAYCDSCLKRNPKRRKDT